MNKTVIFDLDGTLAIIEKRRLKAGKTVDGKETNKMDWDVFFDPENIKLDEPNDPVIQCANMFYDWGYQIYIMSGRLDTTKEETIKWLEKHMVSYHELIMRPRKTWKFVPDDKLKKQMLEDHLNKDEVYCIFDDRQKVVDMWRAEGLTCFQVAPGNF